ncbi:MAG TPA: hypothetical protein VLJ68_11810 [Chitinophagaceae bacterium]|nr:hypothetical protein [Chitinophagaceae bacterium]
MKKYLLLIVLAIQAVIVSAQFKADKEPFIVRSLKGESIKMAEIQTSGGGISVTGVNPEEARLEIFVTPNNNKNDMTKEEIQARLDEMYTLEISITGNKLTAKAKSKQDIRDWKKALNISFHAYVPKNFSTDLSTAGGGIHIQDISGNQEFSTSGGGLDVSGVSGKINGRTSGGGIRLSDSKDEIELSTSGGSIHASNCDGKLRLSTSGGSLDLEDLKGEIRATTSGGSIDGNKISGELITHTSGGSIHLKGLTCSLETSTSGGNIYVSMDALGKYVKVSNSGGNIDLELPKSKGMDLDLSANRIKTDHLDNFSGKMDDNNVEGKLNGGGIEVRASAGSGRIYLSLK